jgi:hypothetical protein
MGILRDIDLRKFDCDVYVETGTGLGITLNKAYQIFKRVYSVDLDREKVTKAKLKFPKAIVMCELSVNFLHRLLESGEIQESENVVFFLDAHFPDADFNGASYNVNAPNAVPLKEELALISRYRPRSRDVIICDDARIYFQGPFEGGNVEWLQVPGGLLFLRDIFPAAIIRVSFAEEGYIIIDKR